jgi:RHS repeat-associated protein
LIYIDKPILKTTQMGGNTLKRLMSCLVIVGLLIGMVSPLPVYAADNSYDHEIAALQEPIASVETPSETEDIKTPPTNGDAQNDPEADSDRSTLTEKQPAESAIENTPRSGLLDKESKNPRYKYIDKYMVIPDKAYQAAEKSRLLEEIDLFNAAGSEPMDRDRLIYGRASNYLTVKENVLKGQAQFEQWLRQAELSPKAIPSVEMPPQEPVDPANPAVVQPPASETETPDSEPVEEDTLSNPPDDQNGSPAIEPDHDIEASHDQDNPEADQNPAEDSMPLQESINQVSEKLGTPPGLNENESIDTTDKPEQQLSDQDASENTADSQDPSDDQPPAGDENPVDNGSEIGGNPETTPPTDSNQIKEIPENPQMHEEDIDMLLTGSPTWEDYNNIIGPSAMNNLNKAQYSLFKDNQELVSPQTGDLILKTTDISLPGRNGLDLNISRIFQSNQAVTGDRFTDSALTSYVDYATYDMDRYNLGMGWSLGFPSVEVRGYGDNATLYYHDGNGAAYKVNFTPDSSDSNLEDYDLKDIKFNQDSGTYSNGQKTSSYVLIGRDQAKQYFASDGRLLGIVDRFGNEIKFKHSNVFSNNRCPDYTFWGGTASKLWTTNTYFKYDDTEGVDDDYSLKFQSSGNREDYFSYSALIPVVPGEQYFIYGRLESELTAGECGLACLQFDADGELTTDDELYYYEGFSGQFGWSPLEGYYVNVSSDTRYLCLAFVQRNPGGYVRGSSRLDTVRCCRQNPAISEITDTIGRKVKFDYKYMTGSDFYYDLPGQVVITVKDPSLTDTYSISYDRAECNYGHSWRLADGTRTEELRRTFTLDKVTHPDIENQYVYQRSYRDFSFKDWEKTGGWNASLPQMKLTEVQINDSDQTNISKVCYEYETVTKHLGEEGFFELDRVASRYEQPYGTASPCYKKEYSYEGIYDGATYNNETGYSSTVEEPDRTKDDGYEFTTTVTEPLEGRSRVDNITLKGTKSYQTESSYNDGADIIISTVEEYDDTFHKQPAKIKLEQSNGTDTDTLYKGYSYNSWGGVASETRALTAAQWDNTSQHNQNTTTYTYDPTFKSLESKTYYQSPGVQLSETIDYDSQGRVISTTDAKGQVTEYEYGDSQHPGNLTRTTIDLPGGGSSVTELSYSDASGTKAYPTAITQRYNENGEAKTAVSRKSYDYLWGAVASETDAANNTVTYSYDSMGRVESVVYPPSTGKNGSYATEDHFSYSYELLDGIRVLLVHQEKLQNENPIAIKDSYYDSHGNLIKDAVWDDDRSQWLESSYQYNPYGQLLSYTDPGSNQTDYQYDEMNRIKEVEDALGNRQHFEYDIVGRSKTTYLIPNGGSRQNDYTETTDQWGRVISKKAYPEGYEDPDVAEETYEYDLIGNMISRTDPENHTSQYEYDPLNRLISVTNALNETTDYEYDRLGGLKSQTQYEGSAEFVNSKGYDERGLLTSKSDPLGFAYSYQYNPQGLMSQQEDPEDHLFTYQYYDDSQISQTSVNNKSINYYYHPLGGIERYTVTGGGQGLDYSYSSTGLTVGRTVNSLPVSFDYDLNGNCINMTGPFGLSLDYEIDSLNRPESITAGAKTFAYEYNGDGTIKKLTYPNGITTDYSYDNARRLIKIENKHGSTILSSFSYEYDKNGNITSVTDEVSSTTTSYEYDNINRLVRTIRPDASQINYSYDSRGNRIEMNGSTITHEDFKPGSFTYNEWGEAESYTTPEGATTSYEYDAEGLRTKKTTPDGATRYYCDNAGRVIAEADGSNQVTAEIIWGNKPLARKVGSNYYYYLYNGHGDVIALTDESGNIVNSYDYDEWGNVTSETEQISNPIRYAGEYYDPESGLYYLRARYYDPVLGRFISKDSVEGDITNPLSLNLYTYCINNPLIYLDPSGHYWVQLRDLAAYFGIFSWSDENRATFVMANGIARNYYWDDCVIQDGHIIVDTSDFARDFGLTRSEVEVAAGLIAYLQTHPSGGSEQSIDSNGTYTDMSGSAFVGVGGVWGYLVDSNDNWYQYKGVGIGLPGVNVSTTAPVKGGTVSPGLYTARQISLLGLTWVSSSPIGHPENISDTFGGSLGTDLACGYSNYIYEIVPINPPPFWDK